MSEQPKEQRDPRAGATEPRTFVCPQCGHKTVHLVIPNRVMKILCAKCQKLIAKFG
jgi:transcription elongation factor Elf1